MKNEYQVAFGLVDSVSGKYFYIHFFQKLNSRSMGYKTLVWYTENFSSIEFYENLLKYI